MFRQDGKKPLRGVGVAGAQPCVFWGRLPPALRGVAGRRTGSSRRAASAAGRRGRAGSPFATGAPGSPRSPRPALAPADSATRHSPERRNAVGARRGLQPRLCTVTYPVTYPVTYSVTCPGVLARQPRLSVGRRGAAACSLGYVLEPAPHTRPMRSPTLIFCPNSKSNRKLLGASNTSTTVSPSLNPPTSWPFTNGTPPNTFDALVYVAS